MGEVYVKKITEAEDRSHSTLMTVLAMFAADAVNRAEPDFAGNLLLRTL